MTDSKQIKLYFSFTHKHEFCNALMSLLSAVMSSVVVGVLHKVDRIGSSILVLVHLEVVGGKSERPQDHVPQVLEFTCGRSPQKSITKKKSVLVL